MYFKIKLFIIILLISGCNKEKGLTLEERIESAKCQLITGIKEENDFLVHNPNKYSKEFPIPNFERGLRSLKSRSFLERPLLLCAKFSTKTDKGCPPFCALTWLEEGFNTKGIVIVDEMGKEYEYENFVWDSKLKDWYSSTVRRDQGVLVIVKGYNKWVDPKVISESFWPPINLPIDAFRGKLKVGLIMQDGSHTELIDAYIPPGFIDPCSLNQ